METHCAQGGLSVQVQPGCVLRPVMKTQQVAQDEWTVMATGESWTRDLLWRKSGPIKQGENDGQSATCSQPQLFPFVTAENVTTRSQSENTATTTTIQFPDSDIQLIRDRP